MNRRKFIEYLIKQLFWHLYQLTIFFKVNKSEDEKKLPKYFTT